MANLLIVDDTIETCDLLRRLFTRCGHDAACLHRGAEVVPLMRDVGFDLVLLDMMMPGVDGLDVLAAIRGDPDPDVARTPVAMYTAVCDPAQRARALAIGADEWIVKGTSFPALRRRVEGLLPAPPPRPAG